MSLRLALVLVLVPSLALADVEVVTQQQADTFVVKQPGEKELVDDDGYVLRLSLPTQADFDAWKEPGIRVSLGWIQGYQWGYGPAPNFAPLGATLRPWLRISPEWSLGATFSWQATLGSLRGLQWSATLEPTWHPWRGLGVSLGLGYGGLMGFHARTPDDPFPVFPPRSPDSTVSHTIADDERILNCEAGAWRALGRVEYQFVIGPLFATGPFAQIDVQRTGCIEDFGEEPETGKTIELRQWWTNAGFNLGWWATWR